MLSHLVSKSRNVWSFFLLSFVCTTRDSSFNFYIGILYRGKSKKKKGIDNIFLRGIILKPVGSLGNRSGRKRVFSCVPVSMIKRPSDFLLQVTFSSFQNLRNYDFQMLLGHVVLCVGYFQNFLVKSKFVTFCDDIMKSLLSYYYSKKLHGQLTCPVIFT